MSVGRSPNHEDLYRSTRAACEARLSAKSIFRLLAGSGHRLFPDEAFADLFATIGRNSIPPRIVAVVMVLQRLHGMSDREAVDAFAFDLRWKYAAGVLDFDHPGFVHTVLVDFRERLRRSKRPNRIFEAVLEVAQQAGLIGKKRVLDSTALYDAVATQDTVTLIRSALRGLLRVVDAELAGAIRAVLQRDDDYREVGKPVCDWEDAAAREHLVDALARDGLAALEVVEGRALEPAAQEAATLLATVLGQDLEPSGPGGGFRIARRVAPDRVISTVDPEARHGHKTQARSFDGYKGHVAIDPDSEIITATEVTAGNVGDGSVAEALIGSELDEARKADPDQCLEIYGDASYGTADLVERIEKAGAEAHVKVQAPAARKGMYSLDAFQIDTTEQTARCPAGVLVKLRVQGDGSLLGDFHASCASCPLRPQCTTARDGRVLRLHKKYDTLARSRARQRDPAWKRLYRATRPKVERKIGHLMRRKHGGRRARMRGREKIGQDFSLLAVSVNLARLAVLAPA